MILPIGMAFLSILPTTQSGELESPGYDGSMTFVFENDTFASSDNNFTTGWSITWTTRDVETFGSNNFYRNYRDAWSFLPGIGNSGSTDHLTFSFGQTFATASDISLPNPPQFDQPYAGMLALVGGLHGRTEHSMHSWYWLAGMVGQSSLAEELQTGIHEVIGSELPQGWDTQLEDEFVLNAYYDWKYRLAEAHMTDTASIELLSSTGAGLGTAWIGGWASLFVRTGFNLPDNFGPSFPRTGLGGFPIQIQPPSDVWQVYLFAGGDMQWVGHNIFLDGNNYESSRSVDREPFIAALSYGIGAQRGPVTASIQAYAFTDSYTTQLANNKFGAISLSIQF